MIKKLFNFNKKYRKRISAGALSILLVTSIVMSQITHAAIGFRAASSGNNTDGTTTLTISKPTGVVNGDVMIAIISVRGGTDTTITPPSGWNLINTNDSTTVLKSSIYYKVASGEGSSYIWTPSPLGKASGVISAYSGVDTIAPIMAQANQVNASAASMTAPSVTTTVANAWVIAAYSTATGTTVSAGSSMTLRDQDASTGAGVGSRTTTGLQDVTQAATGASGTKTMTAGAAAVNVGHTIALSPKPTFEQSGYRWFENTDAAGGSSFSSYATSWSAQGSGGDDDEARAVVVDASGNAYVAGKSVDASSMYSNQTLVKYDTAGLEVWSTTWGGDGNDNAESIVIDTSGNIFVVGNTDSSGITAGGTDQTLVKYNSSGVEQWSKTWGGTGTDSATAMVIDTSGNIFVVGDTDSADRSAGGFDQTLVKYNSSGVEQWSKTWGGTGTDYASGVAIDTAGNLFVSGNTNSTDRSAGGYDQTLVKYNSSGVEQWSKTWGGTTDDRTSDTALDASSNIYVIGSSSTDTYQTLVKYNSSGVEQWSKTLSVVANAVSLDSSGNIFIAGRASGGNGDQSIIKYNSSGVKQWSKAWGGDSVDGATAIALDTSGSVYVAGYTSSSGFTAAYFDQTILHLDGATGVAINCLSCVDLATSESDLTMSEVDRTLSEVDRTLSEVDRAMTAYNSVGNLNTIVICEGATNTYTVDVGSSLGSVAQNTAATALAEQQIFRLRALLHVGVNNVAAGNAFKLQYATMSGTCDTSFTGETYADVTTITPLAYANNTVAIDGQGLTVNANDPTHSGHTKILQEYNEANNALTPNTIAPGQDGLWDFALKDNGAAASTSYCFRIVKSDGALLDTYSVIPQITTLAASFEQSGYRWFENADSAGGSTFAKSWGGTGLDVANDVALDGSGNIYTIGSSASTGLTSASSDQTLVKYNSSGVEQWAKTWGGDSIDIAKALTLDTSGNIYVVGETLSTGMTAGGYDQTLVKYDSSGVEQWSKTWGGTSQDTANAVALDTSGNIYVVGSTSSAGLTYAGYDQTLVKYNSSGVEQWSKTWGGSGADEAYDLALDTSGNIYVVGTTASTEIAFALGSDQTLVKYSSAGVEQWSKTLAVYDVASTANALALDTSGNIYVVGTTTSTVPSAAQTLVKYNSSGVMQWGRNWGGNNTTDTSYDIVLDASGNSYVTGYTSVSGLTAGGKDQTLLKFDSSGAIQWGRTWGGTSDDIGKAISMDASGNLYVAGSAASSGLTAGSDDQTLLKFTSSGSIDGCTQCVNRTFSDSIISSSELDYAATEVDRTTSEVDRTTTEVDRTSVATITVVCAGASPIDVGAPLNSVAQNTAATAPAPSTIFRLRTLIHPTVKSLSPGGATLKLQYATMSGACDTSFTDETYADVTASTTIAYADNTNATDGAALVANAGDPTHSSDTKVLQEYNELNNTNIVTAIAPGQDGLWDFALKDNGGTAGASYCFRIVESSGATFTTYSYIPQITIAGGGGPTLDQQLRGGQSVTNGTKQPHTW